MTFENYFGGLSKTQQIFLTTCEEFDSVKLKKEFKKLGKTLYDELWDKFGSGGNNNNYICELEDYINNN